MIVTVTLNPALDLTYSVEALVPHGVHRVAAATERAGGKGLNVARVLHALGEPVLATGLLGGTTGARIADLLAADGVPASFTPIAGETRRTVAVADRRDATGFWEPGPQISAAEWSLMLARFRDLLGKAAVVALCGSLPPGVPIDGYAVMIRLASAADVPTVLDTSGEPLRHGLAAGPTLAKPNAAELAALLAPRDAPAGVSSSAVPVDAVPAGAVPAGADTADAAALPAGWADGSPAHSPFADPARLPVDDLVEAVRAAAPTTGTVVVSRGALGMVVVTRDGVWAGRPPVPMDGNPTGAGDAAVAALARGLRDRTPWPALLADAIALATAAVAAPVAGAVDPGVYRRTLPVVGVTTNGGPRAHTHR
jgi:tagatose 6-phosphate kinase